VRAIEQADPVSGFLEVFKYAVKFSDQPPADTWHCFQTLAGKRLLGSAGCFRGVIVPEQLTDEQLDDLPFRTLFYRYLSSGYSLDPLQPVKRPPLAAIPPARASRGSKRSAAPSHP